MGMLAVCTDIAYCALFVVCIARLARMITATTANSKHAVQASNYAVYVRGLPEDATEAQVQK